MLVTVSTMPASSTLVWRCSWLNSTVPSARVIRVTSTGETRIPRLAKVEYAPAMSMAVTSLLPSTADSTGRSGVRMPMRVAISIAALGPTRCMSCT